MELISIQVGQPRDYIVDGKTIQTAIFKEKVTGPVYAKRLGIHSDRQADQQNHGGVDKAVYGFGLDAYREWERITSTTITEDGQFGENLSFNRLNEGTMLVGDVFTLDGHC